MKPTLDDAPSEPEAETVLDSLARCRVQRTFNRLPSVELLVQPSQHRPHHERSGNGQPGHHTVVDKGSRVSGRGRRRVEVTGVDGCAVGDGVDEGEGRCTLGRGARHRVTDPREGGRVA